MKHIRVARLLAITALLAISIASRAADEGVHVPEYERVVLENGATLLLMPDSEVPLIACSAILAGGTLADPAGREGTASILASLLEKGAGSRDAYAFADAVADVGGTLSASASLEGITVGGQFLAKDAPLMIELLADMLRRPKLDPREFEALRSRQIEFLRSAKDSSLAALSSMYGEAWLFGSHPYARPEPGSEASLAALTQADVTNYFRQQFGADRLVLAVAGDFSVADMRARLERAFGDWSKAPAPAPQAPAPARMTGDRVLLVDAPASTQTYFWLGNVGVARSYPHRAALDLVNTLFGGRFTSMLNTELRIKTGLSYGAKSILERRRQAGSVAISSFTQIETTGEALDRALATLDKLHADGVDAAMVDSARAYVLGQYPLGLETAAQWARVLAEIEFYRLGDDYINGYGRALRAVDVDRADATIREVYPQRKNLAIVLIGRADALREVAQKYGPVTEMKLTDPSFSPAPTARSTE